MKQRFVNVIVTVEVIVALPIGEELTDKMCKDELENKNHFKHISTTRIIDERIEDC